MITEVKQKSCLLYEQQLHIDYIRVLIMAQKLEEITYVLKPADSNLCNCLTAEVAGSTTTKFNPIT